VGQTKTFTASAFDQHGAPFAARFIWTSDEANVAMINSDGVASGLGAGVSNIRASASGVSSMNDVLTVGLCCTPPNPGQGQVVTSVTITTITPTIIVGGDVAFQAVLKDQYNNPVVGGKIPGQWTSSSLDVAAECGNLLLCPISGALPYNMYFSGISPGTADITATYDGITSNAVELIVSAP
jgi:hypothetical protein